MKYTSLTALAAALSFASAQATTIVATEFALTDGFTTGGLDAVTVDSLVTFSGGQQQQMFLGAAYNNGPAGYLFINGGNGFNGAVSTGDDTGRINFGALGASLVTFHAADLANGPATNFSSFDANGVLLESFSTMVDSLNGTDAAEILTFTAVNNVYIAEIRVNLPGPASPVNPPYAAAIDTFSATVVPEPSSTILVGLALSLPFLRRRR